MPNADVLPLYNLFDSGINSPETIYNIAPAAKLKHIAIISSDTFPTIAPIKAPTPVAKPDKITYVIILYIFMPPVFIGIAMDIPSGMSCKQIARARENPKLTEASNPEPIANPSGTLCMASPILTMIPVFKRLLFTSSLYFFVLNFYLQLHHKKSLLQFQ